MKILLRSIYEKPLVIFYLLGMLIAISVFPDQAEEMFITAAPHEDAINPAPLAGGRAADTDRIRQTLESAVVKQRLMDLGLTPGEAMARINALSDSQIHQFASRLDSLQAGGHHGHLVVVLLLVIIILLLI